MKELRFKTRNRLKATRFIRAVQVEPALRGRASAVLLGDAVVVRVPEEDVDVVRFLAAEMGVKPA